MYQQHFYKIIALPDDGPIWRV